VKDPDVWRAPVVALPARGERAASTWFSFGDWRLDPDSHRLVSGDISHRLDPKQMAVLVHLIERAPGLVGHDELLARNWPGVVVGDNTLHQVIRQLRRLLGDDARSPAYIETLARRGYRLRVPVTSGAGEQGTAALALEPTGAPVHRQDEPAWRVQVGPFVSETDDALAAQFADLVQTETITRLRRTTLYEIHDGATAADGNYAINGRIVPGDTGLVFYVTLVEPAGGNVLWADRIEPLDLQRWFAYGRMLAYVAQSLIGIDRAEDLITDGVDRASVRAFCAGMAEWIRFGLGAGGSERVAADHWRQALRIDPRMWRAQWQLVNHFSNRYDQDVDLGTFTERAHDAARALLRMTADDTGRPVPGRWEFVLATLLYRLDLDFDTAEALLQRVRDSHTSSAQVDTELGVIGACRGDLGKASWYLKAAFAAGAGLNDTLSGWILGEVQIAGGHYAAASETLRQTLRQTTDGSNIQIVVRHALVMALVWSGEQSRAEHLLDDSWRVFGERYPYLFCGLLALVGREETARALLAESERRFGRSIARNNYRYWPSFVGHYLLGEHDRAMEWLARVVENREIYVLCHIRRGRWLDPLRDDPRFQAVLHKLTEMERRGSPLRRELLGSAAPVGDASAGHSAERSAADRLVERAREDVSHQDRNSIARALLEQAVELDPGHAEAWALLSLCCSWASDPHAPEQLDAAREAAKRAVGLDPTHGTGQYALGFTYARRGRLGEAIRYLRNAVTLQPTSELAALDLCHLLTWNGQLDEAVAEGLRRLRQSPDVNVWWNISFPLRVLNPAFCRGWIVRGLARHPSDDRRTRLKLELMTLDCLHGEASAAQLRAERILVLAPGYLEGSLTSVEILVAQRRWKPALDWLEPRVPRLGHRATTLSLSARSLDTLYGIALLGIDRCRAAGQVFEQALDRHEATIAGGSEWPGEWLNAAACCAGLGRTATALEHLEGAYRSGYVHHQALMVDPAFDRLRERRAFTRLIRQMKTDVDRMATNVLRQGLLSEMQRVGDSAPPAFLR
jgi:DNA-binding winged helix-turn-helix (wHTH) protein/tetratricopeptide (TPR) repeat protein